MRKTTFLSLFKISTLFLSLLIGVSSAPLYSYDKIDVKSVVPINLKKPKFSTLRIGPDGGIWIINQKENMIQKMSLQGTVANSLKGDGKRALYKKPQDFNFSHDGSLLIVDVGSNRITLVEREDGDQNWEKVKVIAEFPVSKPEAAAISADRIVAVAADGGKSVLIYSRDGVLLHTLVPPLENKFEKIISMGFSPSGRLYVLDEKAELLHRFSPDRRWLGKTSALDEPRALSVDEYGYAYVVTKKGKLFEINPEGKAEGMFGTKGKGRGQFDDPSGVDIKNGVLWVAEEGNGRFQSFDIQNKNKKTALAPRPVSRFQIKMEGDQNKKFDRIYFGPNGKFYGLLKKKNKVEVFDENWKKLKSIGKKGKGEKGFKNLVDLAFGSDNEIWGLDEGEHNLKKISADGKILEIVGEKSRKQGGLKNPTSFAVRDDGTFVVVDKGESRIQVFGNGGLFLFEVGSEGKEKGQFETVTGMAVNEDRISVIDDKRKALIFYDKNGKFVGEIANQENAPEVWQKLETITSDQNGRFFVSDPAAGRVRIFNPMGNFLADLTMEAKQAAYNGRDRLVLQKDKFLQGFQMDFVPDQIEGLKAVDDSGIIQVSWQECPACSEYQIYRSVGNEPFTVWASTNATEIFDEEVNPANFYMYGIRGVSLGGNQGDWNQSNPVKPSRRKDISLISISDVQFSPVFTAAFKYYANNPMGEVTIQNNDDRTHRNVKVSLTLKRYSDYPTEKIIKRLAPGEKKTLPVTLTFNDAVLELTENTPVQVDVKVSYFENNEEKSFNQNKPLLMYARNAIVWNNKSRISSFITPRDEPIVEFSRQAVKSFLTDIRASTVGKPLAKVALMYESLNALNMSYVPDPKTPFSEVSGEKEIIDYVQFPRETLRRRTGDCDDTTALLSSLLESVGVETALVDIPGHIFMMANLEESDPNALGVPAQRLVEFQGSLWIPIETTRLGKDFFEAWKTAKNQIDRAKEDGKVEYLPVLFASKEYPPVTLVENEKDPTTYPEDKVAKPFRSVLEKLQKEKYETALALAEADLKDNPNDKMALMRVAMAHVEGGKVSEGKKIFFELTNEKNPDVQAAAQNNLGNLAYLAGDFKTAEKRYLDAGILAPRDGGILVNRARTAWKLGKDKEAQKFLYEARDLMKDWREFAKDIPSELMPR